MLGELSALGAATLWSFSSFVFSAAARRIGSVNLNYSRLFFAVAFLFITVALAGLPYQMSVRQLLFLILSGVIGIVFGDSFLFKAFSEIGARLSMLVMSMAPAIASFAAFFLLGERLLPMQVLGIIVTVSGIAMVVSRRQVASSEEIRPHPFRGILFAFCGALGQGMGLIVARFAFQEGEIHGLVATFVRIASSFILLTPIMLLRMKKDNAFRALVDDKKAAGLSMLGAVLGPFLGITLSLISIMHTQIGIATTLMATTPIIMLPIAHFLFKERLTLPAIAGAVIAVAGVMILIL